MKTVVKRASHHRHVNDLSVLFYCIQ